jgi:hypothetical protein
MQTIEVKAQRGENGPTVTANYDVGDSVAELITQFGEEVIYSHVRRSLVIALQAYMRAQLDAEKTPETIIESVKEWKPGLRKAAKSPMERAREEIARMSPADRQALAKEIRSRAN